MNAFLNFSKIAKGLSFLAATLMASSAAKVLLADPVKIWISSQQDKIYYDNMVRLYQQEVDADFQAEVQAFGFREMPDKLAIAFKTQTNTPDIVQLDEVFFGMYLQGEAPFVDLTDRVKAGDLMREFAGRVGGKGGGRPDMAQGGGTDVTALKPALADLCNWVAEQLN